MLLEKIPLDVLGDVTMSLLRFFLTFSVFCMFNVRRCVTSPFYALLLNVCNV